MQWIPITFLDHDHAIAQVGLPYTVEVARFQDLNFRKKCEMLIEEIANASHLIC